MDGLSADQVWTDVHGQSLGFHLKHLGGSVDRLTTYLLGESLTEQQLKDLRREQEGSEDIPTLLSVIDTTLQRAEGRLQKVNTERPYEERRVGRQRLPTTVIGLIIHIAEHTQRHLGQAITLSKLLRHAN